ncbi:MAG TPA: twin-arginine translocation signal domain-containing protein [Methyloceanibacter sp.]|jgi:hypothetical protein|nr:twin-arginine translocation signal domain-containing protein [Methyloceanibacter sp.]
MAASESDANSRRNAMKYLLTCAAAAAALGVVAMTPASAEAGWRGWWGGPGVSVYVGPRYHYRHYGYRYRPYYYDRYSYGYGPRWKYRYRDYD